MDFRKYSPLRVVIPHMAYKHLRAPFSTYYCTHKSLATVSSRIKFKTCWLDVHHAKPAFISPHFLPAYLCSLLEPRRYSMHPPFPQPLTPIH